MLESIVSTLRSTTPLTTAEAHCDGPCGVYDPSSARIAAEAVRSMTKKISAMAPPDSNDAIAEGSHCPAQ